MSIQTCKISEKPFAVGEWEQALLQKMDMPFPELHPNERHRLRLAFRNDRSLYHRSCDKTGRDMISIYSQNSPYVVYSQEAYNSDDWSGTDYGQDYDFNRPFFEQFQELRLKVPRMGLQNLEAENSDYCNNAIRNKNCYLIFGSEDNQDLYYSLYSLNNRDGSDLLWCHKCELCYDCVDCVQCYNVKHSQYSQNCVDSAFLYDCQNCQNCLACVGQRNKQYCIFNTQYSKEDYEALLVRYALDTPEGVERLKQQCAEFRLQAPHRFARIKNSENCTGDYIVDSRNCRNSYIVQNCEDISDVLFGVRGKDMYSGCFVGLSGELIYECLSVIDGQNNAMGMYVWGGSDTRYCDFTRYSSHCFGCVGLKRKQYCILNKQYSREEYESLLPRVIDHMKSTGEWGQFFPASFSPFAYNETLAQDVLPLTKEEALARGFRWLDKEEGVRPFKITPQEKYFYERMHVPLPRTNPDLRHSERMALRNPMELWERECSSCQASLHSSYEPQRPERILCESCYLQTI